MGCSCHYYILWEFLILNSNFVISLLRVMHLKTLDFLWLYSSCLTHSFYTQITFTVHTNTHTYTLSRELVCVGSWEFIIGLN